MRGSVDGTFYDDAFGASNPFTPVKGDEQTRQYGTFLAGIDRARTRPSFSLNVGGTSQYTSPNLLAVLPDGTTRRRTRCGGPTEMRERRHPAWITRSTRITRCVSASIVIHGTCATRVSAASIWRTARFETRPRRRTSSGWPRAVRWASASTPSRGCSSRARRHDSSAAVEAPDVRVIDAFTSGGAQVSGGQTRFELEAASDLDYVRGAHSWRVGALGRGRTVPLGRHLELSRHLHVRESRGVQRREAVDLHAARRRSQHHLLGVAGRRLRAGRLARGAQRADLRRRARRHPDARQRPGQRVAAADGRLGAVPQRQADAARLLRLPLRLD